MINDQNISAYFFRPSDRMSILIMPQLLQMIENVCQLMNNFMRYVTMYRYIRESCNVFGRLFLEHNNSYQCFILIKQIKWCYLISYNTIKKFYYYTVHFLAELIAINKQKIVDLISLKIQHIVFRFIFLYIKIFLRYTDFRFLKDSGLGRIYCNVNECNGKCWIGECYEIVTSNISFSSPTATKQLGRRTFFNQRGIE